QDRPQATGIGSAKIRDQVLNLCIRDFGRYAIHPGLSIQCFAQRRSAQMATLPRDEDGQPAWIEIIESVSQFVRCKERHAPAVPQVRRRFQGTILPIVVIPRELDRGFCISKHFQIIAYVVITMAKNKIAACFSNQNLTETERNSFEGPLDGILHWWRAT